MPAGAGNLTSYLHFTQSGSDTGAHRCFGWFCQQPVLGDTVDIVLKGVSLADLGGGWQYLGYADHPEPAEPRQADHRLKPAQPTTDSLSSADKPI
jgi:hypothetical protein